MWIYQLVLLLFFLHFVFFLVFHPLITIYKASQNSTLPRDQRILYIIGILLTWGLGNWVYTVAYRHHHPRWQRLSRTLFITGTITAIVMTYLYHQLPQTA